MPYPRSAYSGPRREEHSGRHAMIGAIIGGGLGAAIGARGGASSGATAGVTLIGAGLGAAFALSLPRMPPRYRYRYTWSDRDEESPHSQPADPGPTRATAGPANTTPPLRPPTDPPAMFSTTQEPSEPRAASHK